MIFLTQYNSSYSVKTLKILKLLKNQKFRDFTLPVKF